MGLFGNKTTATPPFVPDREKRGLLAGIDPRAMGMIMLAGAQDPNIGRTLGNAFMAGRESYLSNEERERQLARQRRQDQYLEEWNQARIDSQGALADKRRAEIEAAAAVAKAKADDLASTQQGIETMRGELVDIGFEASRWPAKEVRTTYQKVLDERVQDMFPDPVKPSKPPTLQYKDRGGVPYTFNPASGAMSRIPGVPAEPPKVGAKAQSDIDSVVEVAMQLAGDSVPNLKADIEAKLRAIKDPTLRKIEADRILQALSKYQRQTMGLE